LNVFDSRVQSVVKVVEGPLKAITAAAPATSSTFLAGTADGRVLEYDYSSNEAHLVKGEAHVGLVSGLAASGGKAVSVGFDDKIKEIEASSFVYVPCTPCIWFIMTNKD
jgi:WD repeat-containing protein 1 (actin-interacting protein 1)